MRQPKMKTKMITMMTCWKARAAIFLIWQPDTSSDTIWGTWTYCHDHHGDFHNEYDDLDDDDDTHHNYDDDDD